MRIGINWNCYGGKLTVQEQIMLMKKNGFEASFVDSARSDVDEVVARMKREQIVCESFHAPFGGINRIWEPGEGGEDMLAQLTDGVFACARNQVPVLVVHLSSGEQPPAVCDVGLERFSRLMDCARREGITVAYENQRKLGNIAVAMELFPDAGFCWDVGHEMCFTAGREYMPLFGNRIVALHLHDNLCEQNGDLHMLPYDGKIDMDRRAEWLANSGYGGAVMLEAIRKNSDFYNAVSPEEYYRRAAEAARRFAASVENANK